MCDPVRKVLVGARCTGTGLKICWTRTQVQVQVYLRKAIWEILEGGSLDAQVGAAKKRIAEAKKRIAEKVTTSNKENHKNGSCRRGLQVRSAESSGCQAVSVRKRARRDAVLAPGVRCERDGGRGAATTRRWVGTMPRSADGQRTGVAGRCSSE